MIKNYLVPNTSEEAIELKAQYGEKAKYLAGGTELNQKFNREVYETLIDLRKINSKVIAKDEKGNIEIGAGVTFQQLVSNEIVPEQLKSAVLYMESRNIRNIATVGGNIGGGKSAADLLPTLLALDAKIKLYGKSENVSVEKYISDRSNDLIEKILICSCALEKSFKSRHYSRSSNDLSIIGTAVAYNLKDGKVSDVSIAVGGASAKVRRLHEVEIALNGSELCKEKIVKLVKESVTPLSDIRGSKEFKAHLAAELVAECFGIN